MTLASEIITTARPRPFGITAAADSVADRMPPHDLEAEAATLGGILINPDELGTVRMLIPSHEAFFKEEHQIIFRELCCLEDARKGVDAGLLLSELKTKGLNEIIGGGEYLKGLCDAVSFASNVPHYAAVVLQKWKIRQLITALTSSLRDCYESGDHEGALLERATSRVFTVAETNIRKFPRPLSEIIPAYLQTLGDEQNQPQQPSGIATGFIELDSLLGGGLQNGDMIIVAARPSMGKTALVMSIIEYVGISLQKACALFSLEMSADAIALRLLSARSGIDSSKIRQRSTTREELQQVGRAAAESAVQNIFIDDTAHINATELRTKAIKLKRKHGLDLLAVDYLGLMQMPRGENRNLQVGEVSMQLKALARELNIPVIVLSQLNRKCEDEGRPPRTSDLRDSGSLEQDADLVLLLHREAMYHKGDQAWADANPDKRHEATVIIGKQRNGAVENVRLNYFPWCTKFANYQPGV